MHDLKDLYIIESPFQLLGAIEALDYFKPKKSVLIVKYSNNKRNNAQIDKLLVLANWTKVIRFRTYNFTSLSELLIIPLIAFLKLTSYKYNRIFVGEPRSAVMQAFLANIKHNKSYFLDDGNLTFYIQDAIKRRKSLKSLIIYSRSFKWFWKIYAGIFFLRHLKEVPDWFTCFDITPVPGQTVSKNSFNYLRKNYICQTENHNRDNVVYFIGGNLSESNIISRENEVLLLSRIFNYYKKPGLKFVYCVHRREEETKLEQIRAISNDIELRFSTYPLELDLIYSRNSVCHIAAFYSTALMTIKEIFRPEDCKMFIIPIKFVNKGFREEIQLAYQGYEKQIEGVNL